MVIRKELSSISAAGEGLPRVPVKLFFLHSGHAVHAGTATVV